MKIKQILNRYKEKVRWLANNNTKAESKEAGKKQEDQDIRFLKAW